MLRLKSEGKQKAKQLRDEAKGGTELSKLSPEDFDGRLDYEPAMQVEHGLNVAARVDVAYTEVGVDQICMHALHTDVPQSIKDPVSSTYNESNH